MVEPPGQLVRRRVLERDDRVFVGIKHAEVKKIARAMEQAAVIDLGVRVNAFFVESSESGRGRNAVEAMSVVKQAKFHDGCQKSGNLSNRSESAQRRVCSYCV